MEGNNEQAKNYKEVAEKVRKRVEHELPILEGMLDAIESSGDSIQLLPQVVHTIAVTAPAESYVFLEDMYALYQNILKRGKTEDINHDVWKSLKKSYSVIKKLHWQEQEEYVRQIEYYKRKIEQRKLEDESIDVDTMLAEESKFFQHVECDISSAIQSYIWILIMGYAPSNEQTKSMRKMLEKAKTILIKVVEKHKRTLETTKHILD